MLIILLVWGEGSRIGEGKAQFAPSRKRFPASVIR